MGAVWIKDKVLKYLADHPGLVVWRDDMARDMNMLPSSISAAIGNMIRDGKEASTHIVVVQQGRAWRWAEKPVTPPVPPRGGGSGEHHSRAQVVRGACRYQSGNDPRTVRRRPGIQAGRPGRMSLAEAIRRLDITRVLLAAGRQLTEVDRDATSEARETIWLACVRASIPEQRTAGVPGHGDTRGTMVAVCRQGF